MTYSNGAVDVVEVDDVQYDADGRRHGHHGRGHGHGHAVGNQHSEIARVLAEALGTFMLTAGILASFIFAPLYGQSSLNWLIYPIIAGVMLTAAMAAFGHVTGGGDFNPAVTIGKAVAGRTAWHHVLPYIIGQLFGALAAAFVVWAIVPDTFANLLQTTRGELLGSSAPGFGDLGPLGQMTAQPGAAPATTFGLGVVFLVEVIFTAIFVAVVLGATRRAARRAGNAPLIVGMTFAALYLMLWPITRGSLNPARAFASVAFAGDINLWHQLWLFALAPLLGAALAGLFYRAFHPGHDHAFDSVATTPGVRTVYGPAYESEPAYTAVDVADPVLIVDEPVDVYDDADATATAAGINYGRGEGDTLYVSDDAVTEDGDVIIFGNDASVVEDIEDADRA